MPSRKYRSGIWARQRLITRTNLGFSVDWGGEELGLAGISKGKLQDVLANSNYRKERGNVGPVLIWLNLESKERFARVAR